MVNKHGAKLVKMIVNRFDRVDPFCVPIKQPVKLSSTSLWLSLLVPPWQWEDVPDEALRDFFELYNKDVSKKKIFQIAVHIGFGFEKELDKRQEIYEVTKRQQKRLFNQVLSGELFSVIIATSSDWLGNEFLKLGYYALSASSVNLSDEYTPGRMPERLQAAKECFIVCLHQGLHHIFSFTSEAAFLYQIILSEVDVDK